MSVFYCFNIFMTS